MRWQRVLDLSYLLDKSVIHSFRDAVVALELDLIVDTAGIEIACWMPAHRFAAEADIQCVGFGFFLANNASLED